MTELAKLEVLGTMMELALRFDMIGLAELVAFTPCWLLLLVLWAQGLESDEACRSKEAEELRANISYMSDFCLRILNLEMRSMTEAVFGAKTAEVSELLRLLVLLACGTEQARCFWCCSLFLRPSRPVSWDCWFWMGGLEIKWFEIMSDLIVRRCDEDEGTPLVESILIKRQQ